jgi:hypothetical protein
MEQYVSCGNFVQPSGDASPDGVSRKINWSLLSDNRRKANCYADNPERINWEAVVQPGEMVIA